MIGGLVATASGQVFDNQMDKNQMDELGELDRRFTAFVNAVHSFIFSIPKLAA